MRKKIFVAGHKGLVGSALVRLLKKNPRHELILRDRESLDLLDQQKTRKFFEEARPQQVYLAAAKVGGIIKNSENQAEFLFENLQIALNVIRSAFDTGVEKLLFLGSSCIYPPSAPQPMKEDSLLTAALEKTNEGYAIAKIAGLKLCEFYNRQYGRQFISAMPTNLYGPGDRFWDEGAHVIPCLLRRFHEAKIENRALVEVFGRGSSLREFLFVDDLAEALSLLMDLYNEAECVNIGSGEEIQMSELAQMISEIVGYQGRIQFDQSKPEGPMRKALDSSKIRSLGWRPRTSLREGLGLTYEAMLRTSALHLL